MTVVKKTPEKLGNHDLCPGCGHGIVLRLIEEVVEELHQENNQIVIAGVGCVCTATPAMHFDRFQAAHGRAAATAEGVKRVRPNVLVFAYQGDGDAYTIGIAESMNAAYRNENITQFVINNVNFGMTGGQMAPTTLVGMKATTAPKGRDPKEHGYPMHMCELMNQLTAPYYLERTSCNTPANVNKTKAAIKKAFQNQLDGKGFSMVEIVTSCPTNWGLDPLESLDFLEQNMLKEFPLGVIRDRSKEGE